jgi:ABC-type taurine transport system substrate-binding protein
MSHHISRRFFLSVGVGAVVPWRRSSAQELPTIRMAYDIPIWTLPFFVATERKLWAANGVTSAFVPGPSGMSNLIAASAGATDLGVAGDISMAIAAMTKVSARIVASFNEVENMEMACVRAIRGPGDLLGRRIAVAQGTPSQRAMPACAPPAICPWRP